jgi:hypothetical protein
MPRSLLIRCVLYVIVFLLIGIAKVYQRRNDAREINQGYYHVYLYGIGLRDHHHYCILHC